MSVETEPLDPIPRYLVESGYPIDELNEAIDFAQERFGWALDDHPKGDNWSEGSPPDFADAIDHNVMRALDLAEGDEYWDAKMELSDALNYLLFLWAAMDHQQDSEGDN